jgi:hypothetical protein
MNASQKEARGTKILTMGVNGMAHFLNLSVIIEGDTEKVYKVLKLFQR